MAKERFLARISDLDVDGNSFYRELLYTVGSGDTVDRCIFWAEHWKGSNQGWQEWSPGNSYVQSVTFTQGPNSAPVPTPPQPTGNPLFPGILWYGSLPLRFLNWTMATGTNSVNNPWINTPAEGLETKGKRMVETNNFGGLWYQFAQYRHDVDIPFNIWCTRVSFFMVLLSGPLGFSAERKDFYMSQVDSSQAKLSFEEV